MFSAQPGDGTLNFLEDCHGDSYGAFARGGAVYVVSHAHDCSRIGGFPQSGSFRRGVAFVNGKTTTVATNTVKYYANFGGKPGTTLLSWFPLMDGGTFTGMGQGAWSITGNSKYIVLAGEFPTVNNKKQYGLVRFPARNQSPNIAPNAYGPEVTASLSKPTLTTPSAGAVKVTWPANWDRDDTKLTYEVIRDSTAIVHTTTANSFFWDRPILTFTDTGVAPGNHTYRIRVKDYAKTAMSDQVSVTVS